eukprot:1894837-Amphidinium_carterae.1
MPQMPVRVKDVSIYPNMSVPFPFLGCSRAYFHVAGKGASSSFTTLATKASTHTVSSLWIRILVCLWRWLAQWTRKKVDTIGDGIKMYTANRHRSANSSPSRTGQFRLC